MVALRPRIFELAEHLVGRGPELQLLDDALDRLAGRGGQAVEVVGAAGIGKTRLLAELGARADARGHIVLTGAGADLERDLPFWVFVDALDEYIESVEPRRLDNLDDEVRAELAQVFPSLSGLGRGASVGPQDERYRVNRAVRELLERLAATKPLVLVLDDVHWADPASIDLLLSLLHRPPSAAVLLVLGARPNQGPERLVGGLERAVRDGELARIELKPLSAEEAAGLLGTKASDERTAALYEESGGNPFYLEQLARSSGADRLVSDRGAASGSDVEVPPLVVAAMSEELGLLSPESRRVLDGASVAGDPFEPELAAAASDVSEREAITALDELVAGDLVRPTSVPRRFRFRHPLVRRAIYEATPAGWRIAAHERMAQALAARGAAPSAQAHHVDISAKVGDRAAIAVLSEAGNDAAQRAPATAARWFSGAVRLLADTAPADQRVELLLASATSMAATGRFAEAHEALLESLTFVPEGATPLRVRVVAWCARVEHLIGLPDQAHARLTAGLDDLADAGGPEAVALMLELATDAMYRLDYASGQDWAQQAVTAADALGDDVLRAASRATLTRSLAWGGEPVRAEAVRSELAPLLDGFSDEQLARRLDAAAELAASEIYLDRFAEAAAHCERALEVGRATGQGELFPEIYAACGVALTLSGRLVDAAALLDTAIEAARLTGNQPGLAWALFCRAFVALPAGDNKLAITAGQESLELATATGQEVIAARAASVLAVALLHEGETARAMDTLKRFAGESFASIPHVWRAYLLELMTGCWLALGRRDEAERAAEQAASSAAASGLRSATGMGHRATAAIALESGNAALAAERALAAAALADEVGTPVEAGLARTLAGRALGQLGEQDLAIEQLQAAVAELEACGALRYRDAAERELRRLGQRIHRRSRPGDLDQTGIASLTERELEIARLIVDRKTNGEIAGHLFLSKKTIETHIRNIFRKLSVSSRVEVARAVEDEDRVATR
ncbi:MAG: AAA family ATPase [Solirubrobacteraceae bacterium]